MKPMRNSITCVLLALLLSHCAPSGSVPIDQVPMYGGMNREANSSLAQADQELIQKGTAAFGSRRKASESWANNGFIYFSGGDEAAAMRRFNQAWLLDPNNPESYWGFGLVMRNRGQNLEATKYYDKAYQLGLREENFLKERSRHASAAGSQ
jgi:tetratricopeptide (TPR) repeat protein